jgi:MtN3 and saliva related transmembrane protein
MTPLDLLGLIATCFTTSAFVPQVWRIWKTRDVSYLIVAIGAALWLAYGLLRADMPVVVANFVVVVLTSAITVMKIRFSR